MSKYLKGRKNSFGYAFKGLGDVLKTQPNARIHVMAAIVVIAAGIWFKISSSDWVRIGLAIALVWVTEILNTSIEYIVDLISPGHHVLAGKAKDAAAAAVLVAAIFAAITGVSVFGPKLWIW